MADAKVSPTNFQFLFSFLFSAMHGSLVTSSLIREFFFSFFFLLGPLEKRQFAQALTELATVNECLRPCSICLSSLDISKQMKYDIVWCIFTVVHKHVMP